jgi:hypothetical chaperone protein
LRRALGLDFGTTNTVLAWAQPHAPADPVVFRFLGSLLFAFRSALCFWDEGEEDYPEVHSEAGPQAIQRFIELAGDCRFIQSLKSFAASRLFESTFVFGREFRFEDLFAEFFAKDRRGTRTRSSTTCRRTSSSAGRSSTSAAGPTRRSRCSATRARSGASASSASARCTSRSPPRSSTRRRSSKAPRCSWPTSAAAPPTSP